MMEIVALTSDPKVFVVRDTSGVPERLCRERDIPRNALDKARTITRERWRTTESWHVEISENPAFNSALYPEQDCVFVSWMYEEKPCETGKAIKLGIKEGIQAIPETKAEKREAKYAALHEESRRRDAAYERQRIQEAADKRWAAEMTALGYKRCHEYGCGDWSLWTVPDTTYGAIAAHFPICPTCAVKIENKEAA